MGRFRLSIGTLLVVVAVAAVGFAAVTIASPFWVGLMTSLTWFLIVASLLGIVYGRGTRRVFWSGFALLGFSNLLLAYHPATSQTVGPYMLAPSMFEKLYTTLHVSEGATGVGGMGTMGTGGSMGGFRSMGGFGGGSPAAGAAQYVDPHGFVLIGRMLEALLWAFLGGWAARYFAANRSVGAAVSPRAARPLPAEPSPGPAEHRTS